MENGLFDIRIRDGWAVILIVGIVGMLVLGRQGDSKFSFHMNVSFSSSKTSANPTPQPSKIERVEEIASTVEQP